MVVLGTDSHKRSHTVAAVDGNGRVLAHKTVVAGPVGHRELRGWAQQWGERTWALEDCRNLSRRLERDLIRAGEQVLRVPPKLMAQARRQGREPGKSDPIDAVAVARAALREPDLPVARLEGPERELRLWVDHRDDLVAERTRAQNRLLWHLHELDPDLRVAPRALSGIKTCERLQERLAGQSGPVAEIARELLTDIVVATRRINQLERRITKLVAPLAPTLLGLVGCGALTAAKIIGETAGVDRFGSRAAYARHNGTAPIPVWSGNTTRHRLNRGGNRQLNAALHHIAITQLRLSAAARAYFDKRRAAGDTTTEALRALRRRLSDEVYRRLRHDATHLPAPNPLSHAA